MIFRMRPIIPWCALSIPAADPSFTARRTTLAAWGWPLAALVSTPFDVPADIELGPGKLYVVANGIPSAPQRISVQ